MPSTPRHCTERHIYQSIHYHHNLAAVLSRGWAKASACRLQIILSCAVLCHMSLQYTVKIISKRLLGLCKRSTKLGKRLPQLWKRLLKQCRVSKRLTQSSIDVNRFLVNVYSRSVNLGYFYSMSVNVYFGAV